MRSAVAACLAILIVDAAVQVGLVFLLRHGYYTEGIEWPMTLVGAVAFVLLIAGYIPLALELLKRRGRVVGINFVFLGIDWLGAFFSLMSLGELEALCACSVPLPQTYKRKVAQKTFDTLFGTMYALW